MPDFPTPVDESGRRAALDALDVLDTPAEVEFDALAKVAALICGTPIALISLVDADRQWFKANIGLEGLRETHRNVAFCAHTIMRDEVMEVSDASLDERFANNPMVTSKAGIRFYAGAPLKLNNGARIGSLCVIDRQPKKLDAKQREALHHLSVVVVEALKRRRAALSKVDSDAQIDQIVRVLGEGNWEWNLLNGTFVANEAWASTLGQAKNPSGSAPMTMEAWQTRFEPADRARFQSLLTRLRSREIAALDDDFRIVNLQGRPLKVRIHAHIQLWTADDQPEWIAGTQVEIAHTAPAAKPQGEPATWALDIASRTLQWSPAVCQLYGVEPGYQPEFAEFLRIFPGDARLVLERALNRAINLAERLDLELPFTSPTGETGQIRVLGETVFDANQVPIRVEGTIQT